MINIFTQVMIGCAVVNNKLSKIKILTSKAKGKERIES